MNLITFLTLYITSTICQKHEDFEGKEFKKVDKSIFGLNFIDNDNDIICTMKTKDFIPLTAIWYSGNTRFDIKLISIDGDEVSNWIQKNVTDVVQLDYFLSNLDKHVFRFESKKQKFEDQNNDFECVLIVAKKEDFRKNMIVFFNKIAINLFDSTYLEQLKKEISKEFENFAIFYGIKFAKNSDKMPNFNDYELGVYEEVFTSDSSNNSNSLDDNDPLDNIVLLKKTAISVLIQTLLTVFIFGTSIFAGRYSLSKYF